ncbi:galactosylceramidase [Caulobacter radicis]|uniref:galactosylceramidase n=1 Tax=Caulobacter radicis TaxID=2172650 RepID=UPI000D5876BE|nr:galactosylceramidase [Caulobacter radicis]PVM84030.1 galactosylceramidase [Caulobacter radicis]
MRISPPGPAVVAKRRGDFDPSRRRHLLAAGSLLCLAPLSRALAQPASPHAIRLRGDAGGARFDGIGVVTGGGATAVLLKDYPEPQRSQILDLLYKPKFGASVSALLAEIPGDGNSTQGSMPSHMHTREDLSYERGYIWWVLQEAKKRNPALSLDATAWSAPGWIGGGKFWSQDAVDYYVKWLEGLRDAYGLELDAIGCRNEKGQDYAFVKALRRTLNAKGFSRVKVHAFDNWPKDKLDFVKDMTTDAELRDAIDIISAHVFYANAHASAEQQAMAKAMGKPIWNTEDHVYLKGFDCAIGIVRAFNHNWILSGATKVVNWYDIAGVYPLEPYSEDPATVLAHEPWSGHYRVREALWGYAHYGQFTEIGWTYLAGGSGMLPKGGSHATLKSPGADYSLIVETQGATQTQTIRIEIGEGLSPEPLCVWRSTAAEQFVRQGDLTPVDGAVSLVVEPDAIYSLSTTRGQQKGGFEAIPKPAPFPFPYRETFETYASPAAHGWLPRYTADIAGAFELAERPDGKGRCLRQAVPIPTISWAPDWRPYTILGDAGWGDYEVATKVWLNPGDTAAVMGRINHVGTGYGFIPKGYFLELAHDGRCRLVAIRGKKNPKALVGDAEQQAQIKAGKFDGEGGELVLGDTQLAGVAPGQWIKLSLRFEGGRITGLVNDQVVLTAENRLYDKGMAGLLVGADRSRLSTPWFGELVVGQVGGQAPRPARALSRQTPIYAARKSTRPPRSV